MTDQTKQCCKTVFSGHWPTQCRSLAKVEREGKHYCGKHDPVAVDAREKARNEKWRAKFDAEQAAHKAAMAEKEEKTRRADCYPDLLEALRAVISVADRSTVEFDLAHAAIAKATGETT